MPIVAPKNAVTPAGAFFGGIPRIGKADRCSSRSQPAGSPRVARGRSAGGEARQLPFQSLGVLLETGHVANAGWFRFGPTTAGIRAVHTCVGEVAAHEPLSDERSFAGKCDVCLARSAHEARRCHRPGSGDVAARARNAQRARQQGQQVPAAQRAVLANEVWKGPSVSSHDELGLRAQTQLG